MMATQTIFCYRNLLGEIVFLDTKRMIKCVRVPDGGAICMDRIFPEDVETVLKRTGIDIKDKKVEKVSDEEIQDFINWAYQFLKSL